MELEFTCFKSLKDSGAYMEHRFSGPRSIMILGLNSGTIDLTSNGWGHQVCELSLIHIYSYEKI